MGGGAKLMEFWVKLWTFVLIGGVGAFAVLAVVIGIGAFSDIRSLFKSLDAQHSQRSGKTNSE